MGRGGGGAYRIWLKHSLFFPLSKRKLGEVAECLSAVEKPSASPSQLLFHCLSFKTNYACSFQCSTRTKAEAECLGLSLAGSHSAGLHESPRKCSILPVVHRWCEIWLLSWNDEWCQPVFHMQHSGEQFTKAFINTNCSPRLTWLNAESFFFYYLFFVLFCFPLNADIL